MDAAALNQLLLEPPISPNISALFEFETSVRHKEVSVWYKKYYYVPYLISLAYVCTVFVLKRHMKEKKAYNLKWTLVAWNGILALLSIVGFFRFLPEVIHVLRTHGFIYSVCIPSWSKWDVSFFWAWLFLSLKIPELGDTLFLVLRKKRLIFLHWYHHATVLPFCWHGLYAEMGAARYFILMNYFAHSFMYSYYTLQSLNISIPLPLTIALTSSQLLQMFFGFFFCSYAYVIKMKGVTSCLFSDISIKYGMFIYFSYILLFSNFFYQTYINKPRKSKRA